MQPLTPVFNYFSNNAPIILNSLYFSIQIWLLKYFNTYVYTLSLMEYGRNALSVI